LGENPEYRNRGLAVVSGFLRASSEDHRSDKLDGERRNETGTSRAGCASRRARGIIVTVPRCALMSPSRYWPTGMVSEVCHPSSGQWALGVVAHLIECPHRSPKGHNDIQRPLGSSDTNLWAGSKYINIRRPVAGTFSPRRNKIVVALIIQRVSASVGSCIIV
jgi:hypothetical protein